VKSGRIYFALLVLSCCNCICAAQQRSGYLDPSLPPEERARDLVQLMTLDEKVSQLVNQARAIPRLKVPAYDWWSEALHGVVNNGVTEFPEPIGLGATFDAPAIHAMAQVISTEARIKYEQALREHRPSMWFQGLDFWSPNINIFRDPRWGRGQETYGEDPFLTARMGVAFVTGMQGDDPKYYRTVATPKHFAVHSGPEATRHTADVTISKHDQLDTYLPAFRAAVTEGKAGSVMCAYNSVNGQPACASDFLLVDQLRNKWGFQGYVVSDCGAVVDIFRNHRYKASQPEASAVSLLHGMDNECADGSFLVADDSDYKAYRDAVKQGFLKESAIDSALTRLFTARIRLGMFDPPELDPYSTIDERGLNSPENRSLARQIANESMVLLKNDGVLPLKTAGIKMAVVGPLANQTKVLLGNYNGAPTYTVSILDGLLKQFPHDTITYATGTQFLDHDATAMPASTLTVDGRQGVQVRFSRFDMSDINNPKVMPPVASSMESELDASKLRLPPTAANLHPLVIQYDGSLSVPETGDYNLGLSARGFFRLEIGGKKVTSSYDANPDMAPRMGRIHLEAGKPVELHVDYAPAQGRTPEAKLVWSRVDFRPRPDAVDAAKNADVVIAVLGITSELEGEEMQVSEDGFRGGDRTSIELPSPEEDLLEALAASSKPVILVMTNGSALAINWAKAHANAILDAWYPGEEGGTAVAETLSGKNNPAGRLPVTFYTGVDQLPPFDDYAMRGRTYRYFTGAPLYPFGYGLSYTTFAYSGLSLPTSPLSAGQPLAVDVTVTNTGKVAGDEVAQLYLRFPKVGGAPNIALRGFQRIHLDVGQSQKVTFELKPRDMSMVSEAGEPIIPEGEYAVSIGGGQPGIGAPSVTGTIEIKGSIVLPE
jgi:beta-glucosidase